MTIKTNHVLCDFVYEGEMGDVYKKLKKAALNGDLHIVDECVHYFNPYGISIIFVLAESHVSVHTWEEENKINVDLFTCGENDPEITLNHFLNQFTVKSKTIQYIKRN